MKWSVSSFDDMGSVLTRESLGNDDSARAAATHRRTRFTQAPSVRGPSMPSRRDGAESGRASCDTIAYELIRELQPAPLAMAQDGTKSSSASSDLVKRLIERDHLGASRPEREH
jgi:hypothetical protein